MRLKSGRAGVAESVCGTDIFNKASSDSEADKKEYVACIHSDHLSLRENGQKWASMNAMFSHHLQLERKCQLQQLMLQRLCELHPPVAVSAPPWTHAEPREKNRRQIKNYLLMKHIQSYNGAEKSKEKAENIMKKD